MASLGASDAATFVLSAAEKELYDATVEYLKCVEVTNNLETWKANSSIAARSGRSILVSDFRTSVKSCIAGSITELATIAGASKHNQFRLLTFCGVRIEHLGDVEKS